MQFKIIEGGDLIRPFNVRANTKASARACARTHKHARIQCSKNKGYDCVSAKLKAYYFVKCKNYCIRLKFKINNCAKILPYS